MTRPVYWSIRRELWENRSLYVAPLLVAGIFLFGFMISLIRLPQRIHAATAFDPAKQRATVAMPFSVVAGLLMMTGFIVGVFYCLDALQGERRDRSILFWKSLPVSDRITVLSKASIPMVVLPLIVFCIVVPMQITMLFLSAGRLLGDGRSLALMWASLPLFQLELAFLYALIAIALWHAPLYAWLLLVSAWARRAALLWAALPLLAIGVFEKIAFGTTLFASSLKYRLLGWFSQAFSGSQNSIPANPLAELTPGKFLTTPGLWAGLIFAAAFLAAAVRLRRNREPI
jgi:ABC-2 type transport system permease protein